MTDVPSNNAVNSQDRETGKSRQIEQGGPEQPGLVREYELAVTIERDAVVLPLVRGRRRALSGAVYDRDGKLVVHSQRIGGGRDESNPPSIQRPESSFRIEGRSLFGGILFRNFGHTLLEGTSRFWALSAMQERPPRIVYQASTPDVRDVFRRMRADGYFSVLLDVAGYMIEDIVLVEDKPAVCEELIVPQTALAISKYVHPRFCEFFDEVADRLKSRSAAGPGGQRIYLSRSLLKGKKRRADNEPEIEQLAKAAGFQIVHPQTLPFEEQVAVIRGADVVAGCDGSAMHLTIFARPKTRIICFDSRVGLTQRLIEQLRGLEGVRIEMPGVKKAPVEGGVHGKRVQTWTADLHEVRQAFSQYK